MTAGQSGQAEEGRPGVESCVALAVLAAAVGLNTVDRNMFGLLLPMIRADIPMSDTALGFLMGPAFVIVYSIAGVPIAWMADRIGRRAIIAAGLAAWSMVTAATGLAASVGQLAMARILLGIGEASNMAPSSALIGDMFRGRGRVIALAAFSAGGPLAIMAFYPLIGWVARAQGWRAAYPMMGLVGLVVAALVLLLVREPSRGRRADARAVGKPGLRAAAGSILRSGPFLLLCLGGTMVSIDYSAWLAWLPSFMMRVHGLDAQQVGAMIGMYKGLVGVGATIGAGLFVTWLMRFDERWLAWAPAIFCLLMAPAQLMLLLAREPIYWHVGLALETILLSGVTPALFALLITLLDPALRATGAALYLLIFNLVGQSLGPLAVGALNDGPFASFGDDAVRYSLLIAPALVMLGGVILLGLSAVMAPGRRVVEQAA